MYRYDQSTSRYASLGQERLRSLGKGSCSYGNTNARAMPNSIRCKCVLSLVQEQAIGVVNSISATVGHVLAQLG